MWRKQIQHPPLTRRFEPRHLPDSAAGMLGGSSPIEQFLDALTSYGGDDQVLFVMLDSLDLHRAVRLHLWRIGQTGINVCHADSAQVWQDAVLTLANLLAHRQLNCGRHNGDLDMATELHASSTGCVIWPDYREAAGEGDTCRCRDRRRSLAQAKHEYGGLFEERGTVGGKGVKCRCNRSDCVICCHRRFESICDRLRRECVDAFGPSLVLLLTLTYRASSSLTSAQWMKRAHRDLDNLRARWRRKWGATPPHLWSLEFTAAGTPHFHIMIPSGSEEYLRLLHTWLSEAWTGITGVRREPGTGYQRAVRIDGPMPLAEAINYVMKSVESPTCNLPVPSGTPAFRRWARSRDW